MRRKGRSGRPLCPSSPSRGGQSFSLATVGQPKGWDHSDTYVTDPSTIPLGQLPLQTVLRFEPAQEDIASAYLQSLARREGVPPPSVPAVIRAATRRIDDHMDRPLPPNGSEPIPYLDLRQAITQLQLERRTPGRSSDETGGTGGGDDLAALCKAVNYRSITDAWVDQRHWAKLDVSLMQKHGTRPCADER